MAYSSCCFEEWRVVPFAAYRLNAQTSRGRRPRGEQQAGERKADGDAAHADACARACGACGGARAAYLRALRRRRLRAALPVSRQPTACGPATCVECGLHPARAAQLGRCRRLLRRAPANPRALCRSAIRLRVRPLRPSPLHPTLCAARRPMFMATTRAGVARPWSSRRTLLTAFASRRVRAASCVSTVRALVDG